MLNFTGQCDQYDMLLRRGKLLDLVGKSLYEIRLRHKKRMFDEEE
jgi:hypothetical protein